MAPNTAFNFLVSGVVLFLLNSPGRRRLRLVQNLSLVVAFHSLLALLGYVYSANYLHGVGSYVPMAVHTAGLFLLLALGVLFAQTNYGAMALFVSQTPGGAGFATRLEIDPLGPRKSRRSHTPSLTLLGKLPRIVPC
jgi:hypothetical protein